MEIIIKGSQVKSIEDFHKQIKEILDFPDYYGENLDALWDCLTGWIETPLTLIWQDFKTSKFYLGEYADRLINIFKAAEKEVKGFKIECR